MKRYIKSDIENNYGDYIVRFIPEDGGTPEEYYYPTEKDAENHLNLFEDDDSGLYKYIAIIDPSNTVTHILVFNKDGTVQDNLKDGDIVRLRPEYANPEELKYLYEIYNINEGSGRCTIGCLNSGMALGSSETVGLEMIKKVANPEEVLKEVKSSTYVKSVNYENRDYDITQDLYDNTRYKLVRDVIDEGLSITHYKDTDSYWIEQTYYYSPRKVELVKKEMARLYPDLVYVY